MKFKVSQPSKVFLDNKTYLLEEGDEVTVHEHKNNRCKIKTKVEHKIGNEIDQIADNITQNINLQPLNITQEIPQKEIKLDNLSSDITNHNKHQEVPQSNQMLIEQEIGKIFKKGPLDLDSVTQPQENQESQELQGIIIESEDQTQEELQITEPKLGEKSQELITESAVKRKYIEVTNGDEEPQYFSPASANDNYVLYFLDRLLKSNKFKNGNYEIKIIRKLPPNCKMLSLETFLKILVPIPEKKS